jgi:putative nucleotidyltransferase with HDIG domain
VREQRPIYVNQAPVSQRVSHEIVERFGIQSILGVPLFSEKQVVGALVLMDQKNPARFGSMDLDVAQLFAQQAAQALTHARLYEKIQEQTRALTSALGEIRSSYSQTLAALSAALDARDRETEGHSRRVTAYALLLADALQIQNTATREAIEWGALLHDVGKIGVPDAILHKPSALNEAEWDIMRRHPEIGYQILQSIPFLQPAFAIVRHHHERWDGNGYPMRLSGTDIPLPARIFAIADTLDAITTHRPYRAAQPFHAAYSEITSHRGTQFDPEVVDAFVAISEGTWRAAAVP